MQCFVCGEQMRVVMVEPHVIDMRGFELRTFQCIGCGDLEKRPVFDSTHALPTPVPVPQAIAAPAAGTPAPSSKMKTILGGLVRLRGASHP
jgi:hypothetical protein